VFDRRRSQQRVVPVRQTPSAPRPPSRTGGLVAVGDFHLTGEAHDEDIGPLDGRSDIVRQRLCTALQFSAVTDPKELTCQTRLLDPQEPLTSYIGPPQRKIGTVFPAFPSRF
jgi:hypothetical protein